MVDIDKLLISLRQSNYSNSETFLQAVEEVLISIKPLLDSDPKYNEHNIIGRILIPDRMFKFKVTWMDDQGKIQVNTGYRVQFNNSLGPYKGGLRFHPTVSADILSFLGFEQIFKNALTGLPIGGGKGGSDFDPKGKSDFEVMRFCRSFMTELRKYIGPRIDVPAGDIGVGAREIGYLFGTYKKITSSYEGILTGKPGMFGGSKIRPEATGYGLIYFAERMLEIEGKEKLKGKTCLVSGSGNVAMFAIEKLYHLGAKPVTCSGSKGMIYDENGIDLALIKKIREDRASLSTYTKTHSHAKWTKVEDYPKGRNPLWSIPAFGAFPCATQNEINENDAKALIKNKCVIIGEGANMPSTKEATDLFVESKSLFAPAKAANAGGVAVSEFEMSQNASMQSWSAEVVDTKLKETMYSICDKVSSTAKEYKMSGNYVSGANIAGFKKVADAMIAEGI